MSDDKPETLQAFFHQGVFTSTCPACNTSHDFQPSEFLKKQIAHTCQCGRTFQVIATGPRASHRKAVHLTGLLYVNPRKGITRVPCTVHDISTKGIGFTIPLISAEMVDTMKLKLKLDDRQKTPLVLPCKVRRKKREGATLLLGAEFRGLDLNSEKILADYLLS